jgi:hypothetical protein
MSTYTNCLGLSAYDNNECGLTEKARIRAMAFVKKGVTIANPTNQATWTALEASSAAQITAGALPDLVVIRDVRGAKTDSPIEGTGFGSNPSDFQGFNFEVTAVDENINPQNVSFYNSFSKLAKNYKLWFVTETLLWQTREVITVIPQLPIQEDVAGAINWNIMVKWASEDQPIPYGKPGDFFEL